MSDITTNEDSTYYGRTINYFQNAFTIKADDGNVIGVRDTEIPIAGDEYITTEVNKDENDLSFLKIKHKTKNSTDTTINNPKLTWDDNNEPKITIPKIAVDACGHVSGEEIDVSLDSLKITIKQEENSTDDGKLSYKIYQGNYSQTINIPLDLILNRVEVIEVKDSTIEPEENLYIYDETNKKAYKYIKNNDDTYQKIEISGITKLGTHILMEFKTAENTISEIYISSSDFNLYKGIAKEQIAVQVNEETQEISATIIGNSIGAAQLAKATYNSADCSLTLPFIYDTINIKEETE